MRRASDLSGFWVCFFANLLLQAGWLLPALAAFLLHRLWVLPSWPGYLLLGLWLGSSLAATLLVIWVSRNSQGVSRPAPNKNPYSARNETYLPSGSPQDPNPSQG